MTTPSVAPKPVAIDLFCGLGGWTKGFLAEGYDVIGFDIEHKPSYPGEFIEMDVAKLSGYDLRAVNPTVIVASPPCQRYSYMAMPWDRAKREIRWQEWSTTSPFSTGFDLNDLFNHCLRIAREAGCPLVIENVKGAQPWVGRAKARFGSYYLWGNIASVGGAIVPEKPVFGCSRLRAEKALKFNPDGTAHGQGSWFKIADSKNRGSRKSAAQSPGKMWSDRPSDSQWSGTHGIKQGGEWWHDPESLTRRFSSASPGRKAASAAIAEIPYDLANWIAKVFKP